MYVHHSGLHVYRILFRSFWPPNQCSFAVDKVMIKEVTTTTTTLITVYPAPLSGVQ